jgi:parallel beta-helix repeat protein
MTLKKMNVIHNVVDNIGDPSKPNPYGMGIYIMESHYSVIRGNKVTNTLINTDNSELLPPGAIALNGSIECVVDSNTVQVSHKYGIMVDEGFNTTVTNNIIDNTGMSGIYLSNTSGNMVSGNTLTHIKDYAVKGFFVHTSRKGFDNLNIDQYKNSPTGQNITITNNNFSTSRTDRAIYMMGDQPNPSTNYVGNQIQNIKVFNNTIHMQNHSADFVHFEREVGGTNSAHDNNVVQ